MALYQSIGGRERSGGPEIHATEEVQKTHSCRGIGPEEEAKFAGEIESDREAGESDLEGEDGFKVGLRNRELSDVYNIYSKTTLLHLKAALIRSTEGNGVLRRG